MTWEDQAVDALEQLQGLAARVESLSVAVYVCVALSTLMLGLAVVLLILLLQMRARNRKVEAWLAREFQALRERERAAPPPVAVAMPVAAPPPVPSELRARVTPRQRPLQRQREAPPEPREPLDLIATINQLLAGNEPYNFVETVAALDPQLQLERLSPRGGTDVFTAKEIYLEPGGDGLFASVEGERALLYPNYGRFSTTLDPKPLFEGARHGARIHSILQPALLQRQGGDAWKLLQKGRVQMRQGN